MVPFFSRCLLANYLLIYYIDYSEIIIKIKITSIIFYHLSSFSSYNSYIYIFYFLRK